MLSVGKNGFIDVRPENLTGVVHAAGATAYTMSIFNSAGGVQMVDLTYSISSDNAVMLGPATVAATDSVLAPFTFVVIPNPGLANGTPITGSVSASIPTSSDSSIVSLTVVPPREILHRWSFNFDASDSVGGADAVLYNGAYVDPGELVLPGIDEYAELPISASLSSLTFVSVEMWVDWNGVSPWQRFFDFGTGTTVYWIMTPKASDTGFPRVAITTGGNPTEQRTDMDGPFPSGYTHVVYTLDGAGTFEQSKLYINGVQVAAHSEASHLDPAELGPLTNIWLGRSQYDDPYLEARFEEFVIHGTVLTDLEVDQQYRGEIFVDGFEWGTTDHWSVTSP